MKKFKRIAALLLSVSMLAGLAACSNGTTTTSTPPKDDGETPAASDYKVAMITDYGDITDQSFNQTTYEACKAFCDANGVEFSYYKPNGDNTAERVAMVDAAVADGYNVIVMPGYAFGGTVAEASEQ